MAKLSENGKSREMRMLMRDYVLILANTGMREGTETANLMWKHVRMFQENGHTFIEMSVRGKTGRRDIICRSNTLTYLKRIHERSETLSKMTFEQLLKAKVNKPVFSLSDGTVTKNLRQTFKAFLKFCGLLECPRTGKDRTLYSLRHTYSVIDQGYSYLSTMLQNKADFILEYNEKTEKTLRKDQVDWSQSRVIFISPSFNSYQKNSVNFKDMPFELWEIKRFNNDIISLVQHLPTSKEKIENITASGSVISSVNAEIEVTDEAEHVAKTSAECGEVWEGLKDYFGNLEDTSFSSKKHYIRVNKGSTAICYVYFRKTSLMISIVRGTLYPDGTKSKNYIDIDDPKGVGAAKEFTWRNGNKGHEYQFSVTTPKDVEYATLLLKQKYDSI